MASLTEQVLSTLPGDPLTGLRRADRLWESYRQGNLPVTPVIQSQTEALDAVDWDVVISGGTLGILVGAALVQRGWRVALIERGVLRGRDQEWNISRQELTSLVTLGLLTETELEAAIATEYNPARIAFHGGQEFWVRDVLNIGVDPVYLLESVKQTFLAAGGQLLEHTGFESATIYRNGVEVQAGQRLTTRLLIDAMGHFSPIARQARGNAQPDAICLVVGTCAKGFPANETGDLLASITPLQQQCQYFWEAFPARDGRTTYLFTYLDAHPQRPSLEALFEDYFHLLPTYQDVALNQLEVVRALFGFFPCYRDSPLRSPWPHLLFVGDSSGAQSPLSFGGFGAMIRHLPRLTAGIHSALQTNRLDVASLALLQPYQPSLSVTWLFQQAMSARIGQTLPPDQINQLLSTVFAEMAQLGDRVLKPFLQDVVQFPALVQTLALTSIHHPALVLKLLPQLGVGELVGWMRHFVALGLYEGLQSVGRSLQPWIKTLPPAQQYLWQRRLEAWTYGSGRDYHHADESST